MTRNVMDHPLYSSATPRRSLASVSYGADGLSLVGFQAVKLCWRRQRRIGRQRGDTTGSCFGRETCHLEHHESHKGNAGEGARIGEVIDLSCETLSDGVRRITGGNGVDIVIDAIGGKILSQVLATLAPGGSLTTLGYSAAAKQPLMLQI